MAKLTYDDVEYNIRAQDIYQRCKLFFEKRFGREFIPADDSYAHEWLERFISGTPSRYMDGDSKKIYSDFMNDWIFHKSDLE